MGVIFVPTFKAHAFGPYALNARTNIMLLLTELEVYTRVRSMRLEFRNKYFALTFVSKVSKAFYCM